jgi:hypothetical protein
VIQGAEITSVSQDAGGYEGHGAFSNSLTIYFTADLSPWIGDMPVSLIYINNPQLRGFFRLNRTSQSGFFAINILGDPSVDPDTAANAAADLSERRLIELIRMAVGVDDLNVKIDGHTRWRATACVAERLQEGRIFVAGDAAHLMPPNGGFGGNTGVADAHNLAWKLALVINGHQIPATHRRQNLHGSIGCSKTRRQCAEDGGHSLGSRPNSKALHVKTSARGFRLRRQLDSDFDVGALNDFAATGAQLTTSRTLPALEINGMGASLSGVRLFRYALCVDIVHEASPVTAARKKEQ